MNTNIINFNYSNKNEINSFNLGLNINEDLKVTEKLKNTISKFVNKNQEEYKDSIIKPEFDIKEINNEDK